MKKLKRILCSSKQINNNISIDQRDQRETFEGKGEGAIKRIS